MPRNDEQPDNADDVARLTDEQVAAIRAMEPPDIVATRSFFALLDK